MATPKTRTRYPKLPSSIEAPGGTVEVRLVDGITEGGTECWGLYDPANRLITIDRTASLRHQWKTYYHEWAHVAFLDAGLDSGLPTNLHEVLCESIATARMRETFG